MDRKPYDWTYVQKKIAHLKRIGLVSQNSPGIGKNGGAAPDWLIKQQRGERDQSAA